MVRKACLKAPSRCSSLLWPFPLNDDAAKRHPAGATLTQWRDQGKKQVEEAKDIMTKTTAATLSAALEALIPLSGGKSDGSSWLQDLPTSASFDGAHAEGSGDSLCG